MTKASPLDHAIDTLYGAPLDAFVTRRKELAAELKKGGKPEEAAALAALAKPSISAWAVNHLAREAPEELEALFASGTELRKAVIAAMRGGDARQVAPLQAAHRDEVGSLVKRARAELTKSGQAASDAIVSRIRTSLTTLSTTGRWGDVRPGALTKDLDPIDVSALATLVDAEGGGAGHERRPPPARESSVSARAQPSKHAARGSSGPHPATTHATRAHAAKEDAAREQAAREAARREKEAAKRDREAAADALARASKHRTEATGEAVRAKKAEAGAARASDEAAARVDELEAQLVEARREAAVAVKAHHDATSERAKAEKRASEAEHAEARARAALDRADKALSRLG